jgi:hypothetical protein
LFTPGSNSVTLPPEIMDKILEHISTNREGQLTLIACALVATWWTGPSQRRLFSSVSIDGDNYRRWMNGVVHSGSNGHLLECVRSLRYCLGRDTGIRYSMRNLQEHSGEYFSALRNIHSLTLFNPRVQHISEENFRVCFSAFRGTLTHLSLERFATSFSAFVTLVDYFPNITALHLCSFALGPDEGPVPPLSRPLRGKIHVRHVRTHCLEFFNRLAKLDLEYEELVIDSLRVMGGSAFLESTLQLSTNTVKYLRLTAELRREHPYRTPPSLHVLTQPLAFEPERRR